MVHDFIQLQRDQMIDLRDARVDHHLSIPRDRHGPIEHLRDEFLDQVFAAFLGSRFDAETSFFDDLIQQASFENLFGSGGRRGRGLTISHWIPPPCPFLP